MEGNKAYVLRLIFGALHFRGVLGDGVFFALVKSLFGRRKFASSSLFLYLLLVCHERELKYSNFSVNGLWAPFLTSKLAVNSSILPRVFLLFLKEPMAGFRPGPIQHMIPAAPKKGRSRNSRKSIFIILAGLWLRGFALPAGLRRQQA